MKLTKAQEEAIRRARADGGMLLAHGGRPRVGDRRYDRPIPLPTARRLVELGLTEWVRPPVYQKYRGGGGAWDWSARLTDVVTK
jgi:hypothetical protein